MPNIIYLLTDEYKNGIKRINHLANIFSHQILNVKGLTDSSKSL